MLDNLFQFLTRQASHYPLTWSKGMVVTRSQVNLHTGQPQPARVGEEKGKDCSKHSIGTLLHKSSAVKYGLCSCTQHTCEYLEP